MIHLLIMCYCADMNLPLCTGATNKSIDSKDIAHFNWLALQIMGY